MMKQTYITTLDVTLLLTTNVDFDLAEVHPVQGGFNLHDEISATRHVARALQVDCSSVTDDTWILTTHVVVPQGGLGDRRRHVRQSNDEVVRVKASTKTTNMSSTDGLTVGNARKVVKKRNDNTGVARIFSAVHFFPKKS